MKKLLALTILPFALGLVGCSGGNPDKDLTDLALDSLPMLIDTTKGKEILATEAAINSADQTSYLALNTLTYKEKEFELEWVAAPAEKWVSKVYTTDETRTKYMPLYGDEEFECSLTLNLNIVGSKYVASKTWKFNAAPHVKPDLSEYTFYTLENLQKAYKAKPAELTSKKVYTYGQIVAHHEAPDHVYSGVYIQDGAYGLMLYSGQLSKLWESMDLVLGDKILVTGTITPYSGLVELQPAKIESLDFYPEYTVATPVVNDLTNLTFDYANVGVYQGSLVEFKGLTFKQFKTRASTNNKKAGEVIFTKGETEITVSINYHLGEEMTEAVNNLMDTLTAGTSVVDFNGVLSIYNEKPQLIPVFGASSFEVK